MLVYTPGSTLLHNIDPRVKIFSLMAGLSAILLAGEWAACLSLTAMAAASTLAAESTLREIWRDIYALWIFYLMTILIHMLIAGTMNFHDIELIRSSIEKGLFFATKIALTSVYTAPFFRTSHPQDFAGLLVRKCKLIPRLTLKLKRIGFVLQTTMRFLPLILNEIERIRTVHRCRGLVLKGGLRQRITKLPAFIIPIIDSVLRKSVTVSMAMEARGFNIDSDQTNYKPLRINIKDVFAALYVFTCATLIYVI